METRTKKIGTIGITIGVVVMLITLFFMSVGAYPGIVKPSIRTQECEDFEDDVIGNPPTESWYAYTGNHTVAGDEYNTSYPYHMEAQALNLTGPHGNASLFDFNETGYFSIDFYLALFAPDESTNDMVYRIKFLTSASVLLWEMDVVYYYDSTKYDAGFDMNGDDHINFKDYYEFMTAYGSSGSPGWVIEDFNYDGTVNASDLALFVSSYNTTDTFDVYAVDDRSVQTFLYHYVPYGFNHTSWLHTYLQWDYASSPDSVYPVFAVNDAIGWTQPLTHSFPVYAAGVWDRVMFYSQTDTYGYLDNMTLCYTPYDLVVLSTYPVDGTHIDPSFSGSYPTIDFDACIGMLDQTAGTPMVASTTVYRYQEYMEEYTRRFNVDYLQEYFSSTTGSYDTVRDAPICNGKLSRHGHDLGDGTFGWSVGQRYYVSGQGNVGPVSDVYECWGTDDMLDPNNLDSYETLTEDDDLIQNFYVSTTHQITSVSIKMCKTNGFSSAQAKVALIQYVVIGGGGSWMTISSTTLTPIFQWVPITSTQMEWYTFEFPSPYIQVKSTNRYALKVSVDAAVGNSVHVGVDAGSGGIGGGHYRAPNGVSLPVWKATPTHEPYRWMRQLHYGLLGTDEGTAGFRVYGYGSTEADVPGAKWALTRVGLEFDTSVIPDDATIISASLAGKTHQISTTSPTSHGLWLYAFYDPNGTYWHHPALNSDWDRTNYDEGYTYSSALRSNQYFTLPLFQDMINASGATRLMLKEHADAVRPSWADGLDDAYRVADFVLDGTVLTVTYQVPAFRWVPIQTLGNGTINNEETTTSTGNFTWASNMLGFSGNSTTYQGAENYQYFTNFSLNHTIIADKITAKTSSAIGTTQQQYAIYKVVGGAKVLQAYTSTGVTTGLNAVNGSWVTLPIANGFLPASSNIYDNQTVNDAYGSQNAVAGGHVNPYTMQSFTPLTAYQMTGYQMIIGHKTGHAWSGNIEFHLHVCSGGLPSGPVLRTITYPYNSLLDYGHGSIAATWFNFSSPYTLTAGTQYCMELNIPYTGSNTVFYRGSSSDVYTRGQYKYYESGSWHVDAGLSDVWFKCMSVLPDTFPSLSSVTLDAGNYWLGIHFNTCPIGDSSPRFHTTTVGAAVDQMTWVSTAFGSWSGNFTTHGGHYNQIGCIYVGYEYTTSATYTASTLENDHVFDDWRCDWETDYYWYLNVTTVDGKHWEFPQSGSVKGTGSDAKWAYHFMTNPYIPPKVTAWHPLNNSFNQTRKFTLSVEVLSNYHRSGVVEFYMVPSGVTDFRPDHGALIGIVSYDENHTNVTLNYADVIGVSMHNVGYNTSYVWCVTVYEDGQPNLDVGYRYPDSTMAGTWYYGHRVWIYKTPWEYLPYVNSYYPANASHIDNWGENIYVNMTDPNIDDDNSFDFYLLYQGYDDYGHLMTQAVQVYSASKGGFVSPTGRLIENYTTYPFLNGVCNFTFTPANLRAIGISPDNGTVYGWRVIVHDMMYAVASPVTGYHFPTSGTTYHWITYLTDWEHVNKVPRFTINYPHSGTITSAAWQQHHDLQLNIYDYEGDDIYLSISAKCLLMPDVNYYPLNPLLWDVDYFDASYWRDDLYPLHNGTYSFDLSWFMPYDNANYTIQIIAEDGYHQRDQQHVYGRTQTMVLVIGTGDDPNGATYHLSVMKFDPYDGQMDAGDNILTGITGYVALSLPWKDDDFRLTDYQNYTDAPYQLSFFLSDETKVRTSGPVLAYHFYPLVSKHYFSIGGNIYDSYLFVDAVNGTTVSMTGDTGQPTTEYLDIVRNTSASVNGLPWNIVHLPALLNEKSQYSLYFGLYRHPSSLSAVLWWGYEGQVFRFFGEGNLEFDCIYDTCAEYVPEFRYETTNMQETQFIAEPPLNEQGPFAKGDYSFEGGVIRFQTYPTGQGPGQINQAWKNNVVLPIRNLGIGGVDILIAIGIIACFLFMPYLLIRRKAKNVPLPVLASFGFFGAILAFGMGFLSLWMFMIPFLVFIVIIVFKAVAWVTSKRQLIQEIGGGES